jgi:adenosylcobinamide-GDP ribazoletransferase
MKEPTIGAMGAIFVVLFLIMKFSILLDLQNFWLFICIPMLSRWSICVSILFFKYVRLDGMGALIKQEYNTNLFLYSSVYTLLIGICLIGVLFGYLFLLCTATTLLMSYCFSKRFNGLSGDMYGFIIEVNELILLACLVIVFK